MSDLQDPAFYGDRWAATYDADHGFMDPTDCVSVLAQLAGTGRALELGIGTGRVAVPLHHAGVDVAGVDASGAMVARLRAKAGGADIPVAIGDMATMNLGGPYRLVFAVFSTLFGLLAQPAQTACFRNVAQALDGDGRFVVECFVPDLTRYRDGNQATRVISVRPDLLRLNASVHDPVRQQVHSQIVALRDGALSSLPVVIRYAWPSELDLMAELAGLRLESRWGGWRQEPFGASSTTHVSIYAQ